MTRIKVIILSAIVIFSTQAFSQWAGSIDFVNNLGDKKTTTWEDAVVFYVSVLGRGSRGFNGDAATLKDLGIVKKNYDKDKVLRKGMLAGMIARHLKLKDSLLYLIFRTNRYAFRACVADGIMDVDGSEWDKLSGEELIEIMSLVSERME